MKAFLYIRLQQFRIFLKKPVAENRTAWFIIIGLVLLSALVILPGEAWIFYPLPLSLILMIHLMRSDGHLLEKAGTLKPLMYLSEYMILGFPFTVAGIITRHYVPTVLFLLLVLLIALLPFPGYFRVGKTKKNRP